MCPVASSQDTLKDALSDTQLRLPPEIRQSVSAKEVADLPKEEVLTYISNVSSNSSN